MFKLFKSKEEKQVDKQKELEKQLNEFIAKNKDYFNSYCFDGKNIIIYKEPQIKNNELVLWYIDINTPEGYMNCQPIWLFDLKFGNDFMKQHRINFIKLKDQMQKLGLSVTKIKKDE